MAACIGLSLLGCREPADSTVPPATNTELAAADQLDPGERSDGRALPHFDDVGYYEMVETVPLLRVGSSEPQYTEVELMIDPTLAAACGMPEPKVNFATDSAKVKDKHTLKDLAQCLNQHPLDEDLLDITGHADPRGTDEYNRELGLDRANAVAAVLERNGVDRSRIDTYSVGEEEASQSPAQWARDRKVVIRLDR